MTKTEKILKKKAIYKTVMDTILPREQSDRIWADTAAMLTDMLGRYSSLPKGVRTHTENYIFPGAAFYLSAKEAVGQEKAYSILNAAAESGCEAIVKKVSPLMKIPGMPGLFVKMWDPLVKKMFGPDNGFKNAFYPKKKGEYRMDVLACPYCKYMTELGCPEITRVYCENDDRTYGKLPEVKFERTGTLGKGADRCDFCIRKA